jgi:RNA polymerase subunit RPABC4/transcription elongation factor Spt4
MMDQPPPQQTPGEEEEITLKCPHCGGSAFTDYGDGLVACQRCYTQFDLNQQQCPYCGTLLAEDTFICLQCGTDLRGDQAKRFFEERLMTTDDWWRLRRSRVERVRTNAKEASRQRMEAWWEEDRKRREAERQERLARQRRERNVLMIGAVIIVGIILLIVLAGLLAYSSGQLDPTPTVLLLHRTVRS